MRQVNGFFLFELGYIWQLIQMKKGSAKDYLPLIGNCIHILRSFVDDEYNQIDLPDSVATAKVITQQLEQIIQQQKPIITPNITGNLFSYIMHFRSMLMSELGKVYTAVIEDKRGYSIKALWNNPMSLLANDIPPFLSDFIKHNIEEAAKCLLLDRYTAVGFHTMRSVEKIARKYYELITGNQSKYTDKKGKVRDKGLGMIAQELIEKYTSLEQNNLPSGNLGIIGPTIKALSKIYRNPLSHPEIEKLNEDQGITTFRQAIEVISLIVLDAKGGGSHFVKPVSQVKF